MVWGRVSWNHGQETTAGCRRNRPAGLPCRHDRLAALTGVRLPWVQRVPLAELGYGHSGVPVTPLFSYENSAQTPGGGRPSPPTLDYGPGNGGWGLDPMLCVGSERCRSAVCRRRVSMSWTRRFGRSLGMPAICSETRSMTRYGLRRRGPAPSDAGLPQSDCRHRAPGGAYACSPDPYLVGAAQ
jgi:hypothetical protein